MENEIQGYLAEFGILRGQLKDAIKGPCVIRPLK